MGLQYGGTSGTSGMDLRGAIGILCGFGMNLVESICLDIQQRSVMRMPDLSDLGIMKRCINKQSIQGGKFKECGR